MKKELIEKVNDLRDQMDAIVNLAETENRSLTEDEVKQFDSLEEEAKAADATIQRMEAVEKMQNVHIITPQTMTEEERDVKDFANLIRAGVNSEDFRQEDSNITKGDNGAIIPKTIANKIIEAVKDISPIFARAQHYNVKGTLSIPKITAANNGIAMAYADEFVDLESKSAQFTTVDLTGYLAGVLVKVSNSLIKNSDINVTNEVVRLMAQAVAEFYEKETLIGTPGDSTASPVVPRKSKGISDASTITAASASAITADELISLQDSLKSAYQRNACWIVNPATLTALRKLKYSGTGEYILNPDMRQGFGATLLGKPVFTSDQMPTIATGNKTVVYADFGQALAVKLVEQFELKVLTEKYATQHATGFVGWTEFDSDIQNEQAIKVLKMA